MMGILLAQFPKLIALACLLGCSAFFSGSETALFSLTREELHRLETKPGRSGRAILALLRDPQALLSTILFGNMVVNVTFYSISVFLLLEMQKNSPVAAAAVGMAAPLLVIIVGEVSPKGIAVGHPMRVARVVAPVLHVLSCVLWPLTAALKALARRLSHFFLARLPRHPCVTRDELKALAGMAERHGVLDKRTRGMIEQVVEMAHVRVSEVMTPRVDMTVFYLEDGRDTFCSLARLKRMTQVPVCERSRDNIVGVLHAREVFLHPEADLRALVRPLRFAPRTQTVESLLREFRRTGDTVAVVVDEYGGTDGLVTLEHLLEEIVGDIRGEFEPPWEPVQRIDEDTYVLNGDLSTRDWRNLLGFGFEVPGADTVAGFVISRMGRIPKVNDSVEWRGLRFTVTRMSRRRIVKVRVERVGPEEAE